MTDLHPSLPPSSSGARIGGDDLQHLVAWYWCLKALARHADIVLVHVEADVKGNLDDVVIEYRDGTKRYVQVKSTVSAKHRLNAAWLMRTSTSAARSLLGRLFDSWQGLGRPADRIELVTSRALDPDDEWVSLLDRRNKIGAALRRDNRDAVRGTRAELAGHLGCSEDDLCDFFDALEIRAGQTEAEWLRRIEDAAGSVGVRSDKAAVSSALGWIRGWVKDSRSPRGPEQIRSAVDELELRVAEPRHLVVFQGIEAVPAADAVEVVDWSRRFRGERPETRRGLLDPRDWNGALTTDLQELKARLVSGNRRRLIFRGALRLPAWFAIGATFREVASFEVALEYRNAEWAADMTNLALPTIRVRTDERRGGGRTIVVVAISTDATDDVRTSVVDDRTGRLVTVGVGDDPSPSSLRTPAHAIGAAVAVRNWVRANVRSEEIDLVLMAPAPFALFLGHVWDRIGPTTVHEDLVSGYEPAFRVNAEG